MIRLTHDGMPVKSIEVPEVEATAVPEISGYRLVVSPLDVTCPADSRSGVVIPLVPSIVTGMSYPLNHGPARARRHNHADTGIDCHRPSAYCVVACVDG